MTPPPPPEEPLSGWESVLGDVFRGNFSSEGATEAAIVFGVLVGAALAAIILHWIVFKIAAQAARRTPIKGDEIAVKLLRGPSRVVLAVLAVQFAMPALEMPLGVREPLRHGLSIVLIIAVTWLVMRAVRAGAQVVMAQYDIEAADNLRARQVHTQLRVLVRIIGVVVGIVGVGAALMTFPAVRQLGASILASAGIAGVIVGLAAQKVLANFLAGLQIAFAGPIHLDDVVVIDGEWGRIEEITTTYVVVKIWDQRRMIVPFTRVIDQSFTNWTRTSAEILGTVYLHTDYTAPVQAIRDELKRIVEASPHWDKRVVGLVVTDAKPDTLELRALVSAVDGGKAWDLRCEVREKLVGFLQREYPECLPRTRVNLTEPPEESERIAAEARRAPQVPEQPKP